MKNKKSILNRFLCMVMAFMIVFTTVFTSDLTSKKVSQAAGSFPFSSYNGSINYNGSGLDVRFEGTFGRTVRKGEKIYFTARPTEFTKSDELDTVRNGGLPAGIEELRNKIIYDVNSGKEIGRFVNRSDFVASIDIPSGSKMKFQLDNTSVMSPSMLNNIEKTYTYKEGFYVEDKLLDQTTVTAKTVRVGNTGGIVNYTTVLDKNNRPIILDLSTRIGVGDLSPNAYKMYPFNIPLDFSNKANVYKTIDFEINEWENLKALIKNGKRIRGVLDLESDGEYMYSSMDLSSYDIDSKIDYLNTIKEMIQDSSGEGVDYTQVSELGGCLKDRKVNYLGNNLQYKSVDLTQEIVFQFALKGKDGMDLSFIKDIPKSYFLNSDNVTIAQTYPSKRLSNGLQFDNGVVTEINDIDIRLNKNKDVAVVSIKFDMKVGLSNISLAKFYLPIPSNIGFFNRENKPNLDYKEFFPYRSETEYAFAAGTSFSESRWNSFKDRGSLFLDSSDSFPFLENEYDSVTKVPRIRTNTVKTNLDGELIGTTPIPFNKRRVPSEDLEVGKERLKQKGEEGAKRYDGTIVKQPKDEITEYGVRKTVVKTETKNIPFKEIRRPADDLEEGKTRVVQEGQVGKQTRKSTTVINSETGKTISGPTYTNWTTTTKAKDKIIEYGVRKTVVKTETKNIPFKEIRRPADDLEEGKTRVVQEGQVGKQTRKSTTVINSETGKTISGPTYTNWTTTTQPKDRIIEYGRGADIPSTGTTGMLMPLTGGIVLLGYSILPKRKKFK